MRKIFTIICFGLITTTYSQITTDLSLTPTALVNTVLLGGGVTASGVTFSGYTNGLSRFDATAGTGLGFSQGIYLTTGSSLQFDPLGFGGGEDGPAGPYTGFQSISQTGTTINDPELNGLLASLGYPMGGGFPGTTNDVNILEFDFIPTSTSISFRYRFASEEYNEFVSDPTSGGPNDIFGFFIRGVSPAAVASMPTYQNIALIPATTTPVTIYTVNNGNAFGVSTGPCMNCAYYTDNMAGIINTVYDGLTTILTASANVICGETYHIKICIADVSDQAYDSGVFIEGGSFTSPGGGLSISSNISISPLTNDSTMLEGCIGADIAFVRTDATLADTLNYTLTGTATNGIDYTGLTGQVIFPAGVDTIIATINPLADGTTEGLESIIFTFTDVSVCGVISTLTYNIYINEPPPVSVNAGLDQTLDCTTVAAGATLTAAASGGLAPYTYLWSSGGATASTTVFTGGNYFVTATDFCGQTATDSVMINIVGATPINLTNSNDTSICAGNSVTLTANATGGNGTLNYLWSTTSTSTSITVSPSVTTTYTITVSDACVSASDIINVTVSNVIANFSSAATQVEGEFVFTNLSLPAGSSYLWDFGDGNTSTDTDPTHLYDEGGIYTVTLVTTNALGCTDTITRTVQFNVITNIFIPNSFTPNNDDNLNQVFQIYGQYINEPELIIFNRWGQEIYKTTSNPIIWNGTSANNKELMPQGVYAYKFVYKDADLKGHILYGHINLIK